MHSHFSYGKLENAKRKKKKIKSLSNQHLNVVDSCQPFKSAQIVVDIKSHFISNRFQFFLIRCFLFYALEGDAEIILLFEKKKKPIQIRKSIECRSCYFFLLSIKSQRYDRSTPYHLPFLFSLSAGFIWIG